MWFVDEMIFLRTELNSCHRTIIGCFYPCGSQRPLKLCYFIQNGCEREMRDIKDTENISFPVMFIKSFLNTWGKWNSIVTKCTTYVTTNVIRGNKLNSLKRFTECTSVEILLYRCRTVMAAFFFFKMNNIQVIHQALSPKCLLQ